MRHHHHQRPVLSASAAAAAGPAGGPDDDGRPSQRRRRLRPSARASASAASAADWSSGGDNRAPDLSGIPSNLPPAPEGLDEPFSRRRERDPRRLLGVDPDASFEEVQDARNFLSERHRGHAPSREAIERAFDALLQEHLAGRRSGGFQPPSTGRRTDARGAGGAPGGRRAAPTGLGARIGRKFASLWDPTVTTRTVINEGSVFAALALWALFAGEQSFPLAAAGVYCVYQFQAKRVRRDPDGPFFVNSPTAGAVLSTACCLALAVGAGVALAPAVTAVVTAAGEQQARAFVAIATVGTLGVALK